MENPKKGEEMKRILAASLMLVLFSGCAPVRIDPVEEIGTNETAFVVPLEGSGETDQKKFMSLEYLQQAKVAAKRVTIALRYRKIGRFYYEAEWIPTMRLIKVNRTPVTREWVEPIQQGTTGKDDSIQVESKDSIGFSVGVNITALVAEEDAAKFLYYYAGKPLEEVVDQNVRGYVTSVLSREFGSRNLEQCKTDKKAIADLLQQDCQETFSKMGITISNLGLVGGLNYTDKEIQQSINNAYTAGMKILQTQNDAEAQKNINLKELSIAQNNRAMAEEFAKAAQSQVQKTELEIDLTKAQAMKIAAERWNGSMPSSILPQGSSLLFGLDKKEEKSS